MDDLILYHNPNCSKSRAALDLLRQKGLQPAIVLYLETPPGETELKALLDRLGLSARQLLRQGEAAYRQLNLADPAHSEATLIQAIVSHPELIERPILINGDRAIIGRPPERILEILT